MKKSLVLLIALLSINYAYSQNADSIRVAIYFENCFKQLNCSKCIEKSSECNEFTLIMWHLSDIEPVIMYGLYVADDVKEKWYSWYLANKSKITFKCIVNITNLLQIIRNNPLNEELCQKCFDNIDAEKKSILKYP